MESLIMAVLCYLTCMLTVEHSCFMLFNDINTHTNLSPKCYTVITTLRERLYPYTLGN